MTDVLAGLAKIKETGAPGALCTIIKTRGSTPRGAGSKMLVQADGSILGSVGGGEMESLVIEEALDAIQTGEPKLISYDLMDPDQGDPGVCGGSLEVFIDPLGQVDDLVVVGGGHVGRAVVFLAKWLGFRVILTDDRENFASPDTAPGADKYIHCRLEELPELYQLGTRTAVVLATRSNQVDIEGLPGILAAQVAYIGVISSRRRWRLTAEELLKTGLTESELKRIQAPIGLDIQAETPEEIALSIMAQVIQMTRTPAGGNSS